MHVSHTSSLLSVVLIRKRTVRFKQNPLSPFYHHSKRNRMQGHLVCQLLSPLGSYYERSLRQCTKVSSQHLRQSCMKNKKKKTCSTSPLFLLSQSHQLLHRNGVYLPVPGVFIKIGENHFVRFQDEVILSVLRTRHIFPIV